MAGRLAFFPLLLLIAILWPAGGAVADHSRPNIVLIMADDLGVECLECYGGTSYRTPSIDRLAQNGMRFTHAYAQPLCTNTRIQLMTGLYNNRNWLYFGVLDPKAKTIGHFMQEAGYKTCIAGKWQLQSYDPPDYPGAAARRGKGMSVADAGFDEYCVFHAWHTEAKGSRYADPTVYENGKLRHLPGEYGPDVWLEFVTRFIKQNKDSDRPFFVYYPMALPHWPMVPTPNSEDWTDPAKRFHEDTKYFGDMVEYMDQCVGRLVATIDDLNLSEETLILFYSDNGTHLDIVSQTKNGPVRGGKGLTTDAGTHVPLIARWPNHIKTGTCETLVDSTDFLPTLLEVAGHSVNERADKTRPFDGMTFLDDLQGRAGPTREWVFCHFDPRPGWDKDRFTKKRFARTQRFKLYDDGKLFDIARDPLEQRPLSPEDDDPARSRIRRKLADVLRTMPDPETPGQSP